MFNLITRSAISCFTDIVKSFSTDRPYPKEPKEILPEIEDFQYLLDKRILHVDKSLLIKDMIKRKTVLITRPRRWGKSLNIKMLQSFFQPKYSSGGIIINDDKTKEKFSKMLIGSEMLNYHPFTGEEQLTKITDLQGTLPVILFTFNNVEEMTKEAIKSEFIKTLRQGMIQHNYLLNSPKVESQSFKNILKEYVIYNGDNFMEKLIDDHLLLLVESLNQHHGRRVVILIDEYDKTLVHIKSRFPDLYEYACDLYRKIFSVLKNDTDLVQLSVFTGVTRISKEDIFSGINNLFHDSVVESSVCTTGEHYGFTEAEISELIKAVKTFPNIEQDEDTIKEKLARLYNGYRMNNTMIYNPWSVMNCLYYLAYDIPNPYKRFWLRTGSPIILIKALNELGKNKENKVSEENKETKENKENKENQNIETLIKTGKVEFTPNDGTELDKIFTNHDSFLTLMLDAGYITSTDQKNVYRIPNNEVRYEFYTIIARAWFSIEDQTLLNFTINQNEFDDPQKLIEIFHSRVLQKRKREYFPEFYFQTMLYESIRRRSLSANLEYRTPDGKRIDLLVWPENNNETVYIIEVKKKGSKSKDETINKGLTQIFEKDYAANVIHKNKDLKTIIVRVAYFEMNNNFEWEFSIVELKFTRENLIRAIEWFVAETDSDKTKKTNKRKQVSNSGKLFNGLKKFATSYFPRK